MKTITITEQQYRLIMLSLDSAYNSQLDKYAAMIEDQNPSSPDDNTRQQAALCSDIADLYQKLIGTRDSKTTVTDLQDALNILLEYATGPNKTGNPYTNDNVRHALQTITMSYNREPNAWIDGKRTHAEYKQYFQANDMTR